MSDLPKSELEKVDHASHLDSDAADAAYWKTVERFMASVKRSEELPGDDPELPDYDT